ncbi:hypothetical protein [Pendulispora albinea]|uniref:Uncharacterized protein n=1 Tax=Pendulispora albinea TaxID=2741071 RepID=A0ABZ2MCD9_9BACT
MAEGSRAPGSSPGGAAALAPGRARDAGTAAPSGGECATNADCRSWSDTCGGCKCRVLVRNAAPPKCKGDQVACFADPCGHKRAQCTNGACTIIDESAM